ncbi:barstar family protein [Proteiniclasticum ruminis]|uniref:Ribonuclease inhibitor n=1 Tax=Proteiniclasticum ruminis TaxID=398199 RepID=A0A1I5ALQ5_9CLOT|nr:barstar family protein [Proteiniclasticum ruminis]SFN63139.1 ribonuclease inhibitor [Proteiniclasticum ruminis]
MKKVHLNGKRMISKEVTHAYLKRKFNFPDYYGKNLDALWDLLTTLGKDTDIIILHKDCILENLGSYGEALLALFLELPEESDRIKVEIR